MPSHPVVVILDCDFGSGDVEREELARFGIETRFANVQNASEAGQAVRDADVVITQYYPVDETLMEAAPKLRAVVRYGVGLDMIDIEAAQNRSIPVSGITDYCTDEVADHAVALMLAATRSVVSGARATSSGEWPVPTDLPLMVSLRGRRVGLVGLGRIGRAVAERLAPFGVEIVAYDPAVSGASAEELSVRLLDLDEVFRSDVVSLHVPATAGTIGMVDARRLSMMRPGSILVNVARGQLIDSTALAEGLEEYRPAVAALDVVDPEGPGNPLASHPRVILTPHVAYYSAASLDRLRRRAALTAAEFLGMSSA